jgi:hypothetical protein
MALTHINIGVQNRASLTECCSILLGVDCPFSIHKEGSCVASFVCLFYPPNFYKLADDDAFDVSHHFFGGVALKKS